MSLPFQYEYSVKENGSNLSTGQSKRLMLKRVLYWENRRYFIRWATNNLDIELEKLVNNSIIDYLANQLWFL